VDRQLHGMQSALVAVEFDQCRRLEARQLSTELTADRSARTRHEHPSAGHVARHRVGVDVGRSATEQVGLRHRPDVSDPELAEHLVHRGHGEQSKPSVVRDRIDVTDEVTRGARHGEQHVASSVSCRDLAHLADGAAHPYTRDRQPAPVRIVVEQGDRLVPAAGIAEERLHDLLGPLAGADDEQGFGVLEFESRLLLPVQPPDRANGDRAGQRDRGGECRDRTWCAVHEPSEVHDREEDPGEQHGRGQCGDLVEAAVPPPAGVEAGGESEDTLTDDRDGPRTCRRVDFEFIDGEVVPTERRERQRDDPHEAVDQVVHDREAPTYGDQRSLEHRVVVVGHVTPRWRVPHHRRSGRARAIVVLRRPQSCRQNLHEP